VLFSIFILVRDIFLACCQRVCVRKVAVLKAVNLANKIRTKKIREDFRKLAKTSN
jgi:hypothetical protein